MFDYDKIAALLNRLPFDIRAEVVAVDLFEKGIDPDQLIVRPVSIFKRRFRKDLASASVQRNNVGLDELHVEITRDGVYDVLPEGIFHQPKYKKNERNRTTLISDVKRMRDEEEAARKFFQPMENELFRLRAEVERAERKLFLDLEESKTNDLLINFWDLRDYRSYPTLPFLVRLLPIMYRLAGKLEQINICYELLLGVPVSIAVVNVFDSIETNMDGWKMSKHALGFETVLGTQMMNDLPSYQIKIGPVPASQIPHFLPAGKMIKYLELLNSCFLMAGYDLAWEIIPEDPKHVTGEPVTEAYLGVNSYL